MTAGLRRYAARAALAAGFALCAWNGCKGPDEPPGPCDNSPAARQARAQCSFHRADSCHEWWCSHMAWDSGRMDGFVAANEGYFEGGEPNSNKLQGSRAMLYYDQTDIPFYYWLADTFAIGDHYFSSMLGPTWPNRDY